MAEEEPENSIESTTMVFKLNILHRATINSQAQICHKCHQIQSYLSTPAAMVPLVASISAAAKYIGAGGIPRDNAQELLALVPSEVK